MLFYSRWFLKRPYVNFFIINFFFFLLFLYYIICKYIILTKKIFFFPLKNNSGMKGLKAIIAEIHEKYAHNIFVILLGVCV